MMDERTNEKLHLAQLAREVNWALEDYANEWNRRTRSLIITETGEAVRIGDPEELNSEVRKAKARLKKAAADLDEYKEMIGRS